MSTAREFRLSFDYASFRPVDHRWICIDLNTFDGAPDSEGLARFVGHGASEKEAKLDLLDQFAELEINHGN